MRKYQKKFGIISRNYCNKTNDSDWLKLANSIAVNVKPIFIIVLRTFIPFCQELFEFLFKKHLFLNMSSKDEKEVVGSRSLLPPEAALAGINSVTDQPYVSPPLENQIPAVKAELSTPKKSDTENNVPLSAGLDAIDLNIVNLESTSDVRIHDKAHSSPSFKVMRSCQNVLIYISFYRILVRILLTIIEGRQV